MLKNTKEKLRVANFRIAPFLLFGVISGIVIVNSATVLISITAIVIVFCIFAIALLLTDIKRGIVTLFAIMVFLGGLSATITNFAYYKNVGVSIENATITARVKGISYGFEEGEYSEEAKKIFVDSIVVNGKAYCGEGYFDNKSELIFKIGDDVQIEGDITVLGINIKDSYSVKIFNDSIYYKIQSSTLQLGASNTKNKAEVAREDIYHKLKTTLGSRVAGFCYSMLFGDKTYLYPYDQASFRLAGAAHVFAVSGLHVGVFTAVVIGILRLLKAKNVSKLIVVTIVLTLYAWLASFSPSVVRAGVMAIIALSAKALGRRNDIISTVAISGVALLMFKPYWIFDISFLLSFSAVFGIILLYTPFSKLFKKAGYLGKAVAVNLSVNIAILPFTLYFFGYFSLLTLPVNLIIIPIVSVVYLLLLIHILTCYIMPFILVFGAIVKMLVSFSLDLVAKVANVEWAVFRLTLPLYAYIPYYLTIFAMSDYCLIARIKKNIVSTLAFIIYGILFIVSVTL